MTRQDSPRSIGCLLLVGSIVLVCQLAVEPLRASGQDDSSHSFTYAAWRTFRAKLLRDPDVLRYYIFEAASARRRVVQSVAGEREPLRYSGPEPFQRITGRWPQKKAVRLDRGAFQGKPFAVGRAGFAVEMWFRKRGQGALLGNGRTCGMLFAVGTGYWEGLRVWTSYPQQQLRLELGRPKPKNAIGTTSFLRVPDGAWHHLAATWDGRQLRLYVDGLVCGAVEYSGAYTPPAAPLRIGYADAGIGSLKLDVDEFVVWRRSLSPSEVLRHALLGQTIPEKIQQVLTEASDAAARGDWATAEARFRNVVRAKSLPAAVRAVGRLGLAQSLQRQNRTTAAAAEYVQVFDDAAVPDHLRNLAMRLTLLPQRGIAWAIGSRKLYERLVQLPDLSTSEEIAARLCLAKRCLDDGDSPAARKQYEELLKRDDLPQSTRWDVRLQTAHSYRVEKDYPRARAEYARLAKMPGVPAAVRGLALLSSADTFFREKNFAAAEAAFRRVARTDGLLPHHRREAQERADEMQRRLAGQPEFDPLAGRTKLPPAPKPAVTYYVAPDGDDTQPGTREQPFATLHRARDAIRQLKAQRGGRLPAGGVAVIVRGGVYRVRQTLSLTEADSGTAEAPIVYRAAPGERPVFTGGVVLTGLQPVRDPIVLQRLPETVRGRVLQIDLKQNGVTDLGTIQQRGYGFARYPTNPWVDLYVDDRPLELARWPNDGFVRVGRVFRGRFRGPDSRQAGEFAYEDERPNRWQPSDDIWMFGYWGHLWAGRGIKVQQIDRRTHRIRTVQGTSYGFREGMPYYYFNVLEELDRPGEWYLDRRRGVAYLIPPEGHKDGRIEFPILEAPFVKLENVSHVTLRGLQFELGRAEGAVILGGSDDLLAACTFRKLGTHGVVVQGGTHHGVLGCDILNVGSCGVRMAGGDRKTLTPGRHFVENCHIAHFSRVDRVYAPAVHLDGVGNRIAHNLMHDSPHHAMRVEGYDHTIEFNEIHSVVYEADDQAGIDIYGNPTYRGLVIRYNFWHHIGSGHNVAGQAGIRLDDFISAVLIYGNVFYRCSGGKFGGVQIHGGKDNIVENNLFVQCKYALSFSPWGEKRWKQRLEERWTVDAIRRRFGIDITQPPFSTRYPDLARMKENADRNFIWRNLVVDCGQFAVRERGVNEMFDNHRPLRDPGFANAVGRDFSLRPDSPIFDRFGFRAIPFDQIGLYEDEHRATWPVTHQVSDRVVREW